uniref:Uncharacterized protein n=1 Tax=Physcomitrium patens TaxID=3218 RepID=A0A7I4BUG1_PHYPA
MTSLVLYCSQIGILLPGSEGGYVIAEATAPVAGPSSAGRGKVSPESAEIKGVKKADLKVASRANTDNEGGARANDGRGHFSKFGGRVDADQDYNEKLRTTWTIKSLGSTSTQSILRCRRVVMAKEMKLGLTSYSPS